MSLRRRKHQRIDPALPLGTLGESRGTRAERVTALADFGEIGLQPSYAADRSDPTRNNFSMINLEAKPGGVLVPVKVQPGAKRNGIVGFHDGSVRIAVNSAPERGKANQAVIEILADVLNVPRSSIAIITGQTSRQKTFFISSVTVEEVNARLTA